MLSMITVTGICSYRYTYSLVESGNTQWWFQFNFICIVFKTHNLQNKGINAIDDLAKMWLVHYILVFETGILKY